MKLVILVGTAVIVILVTLLLNATWGMSPTVALPIAVVLYLIVRGAVPAVAGEPPVPVGFETVFKGRYVAHWEVSRFEWWREGKQFDGWNSDLFCELVTDDWSWLTAIIGESRSGWRHSPGAAFEMEFRGRIIEVGHFSHMGMCRYRVEVLEVLSVDEKNSNTRSL